MLSLHSHGGMALSTFNISLGPSIGATAVVKRGPYMARPGQQCVCWPPWLPMIYIFHSL